MLLVRDAFAQGLFGGGSRAASGSPNPSLTFFLQILQFLPLILIFYLLLIRPQQQQAKKAKAMLAALKKGDKVVTSGGLMGTIVGLDDHKAVLRDRAREVPGVDDTLRQLIADMRETMKAYGGVGLAANQVGVPQRVLVVDVPVDEGERAAHALINPVVKRRVGTLTGEEGCLSLPGIWDEVTRAERVIVQALDEQGRGIELDAEGYLARAIQHEIDHLEGVLFVDRLSPLRRQFLRRSLDALARGELPEDYQPPLGPPDRGGSF